MNPVMKLETEDGCCNENPRFSDLAKLVEKLNGEDCSDILLTRCIVDKESILNVCGGSRGFVTVILRISEDEPFLHLTDFQRGTDEFDQIIGGVITPLPAKYCVSKSIALKAAKYFFDKGQPDPSIDWE